MTETTNLPIYACADHGVWLNDVRPPELYAPVDPIPTVPDVFREVAWLMYRNTVDTTTVVACSDTDNDHFELVLLVYDSAHKDTKHWLFPRNGLEDFTTSFTARTVQWMVRDNPEVELEQRLTFAAWVLWSWFTFTPPE